MVYVEWLRVRGALKWTAIVLGALFAIAALCRVWTFGFGGDVMSHIARLQADRGSHVSETTGPDGARRTIIDDPRERTHVVIDEYGWGRKHIEVLDRSSHHHKQESIAAGSIQVRTLSSGGGELVVIDTYGLPFWALAAAGMLVGLIFATVVGTPFARENDGHLETTFTKPVGRIALGLATFGVDAAGIAAAFVLGAVFVIACVALFEVPSVQFGTADLPVVLLGFLAPFAWYALLNACTASMRRAYGTIVGFAWPVAFLIVVLSRIDTNGNALLTIVAGVSKVLAIFDPVSYMHMSYPHQVNGVAMREPSLETNVLALALLAVAYGAIALFAWRRIEA